QRIAGEVKTPEQEAQGQHASAYKRHLLAQPEETNPGKNTAQAEQHEHRQLHFQRFYFWSQRGGKHVRADKSPDEEEGHEQTKQSLRDGYAQKSQAAPQKKDRRDRHATLLEFEDDAIGVLNGNVRDIAAES